MNITGLTLLINGINSLIDTGKYADITIGDIHTAIENKRVLRFIKEKADSDINLSLHLNKESIFDDFETYFENQFESLYRGYKGNERRKWGVENSGLCLVIAWTVEIIQQGDNLEWPDI